MNLTPKKRAFPVRCLAVSVLSLLLLWKLLRLPTRFFPRAIRSITDNWTVSMFGVLIRSLATRIYIDQPCCMKRPATFEPKAEVQPQHRLDPADIERFYRQGFLGPFDAFSTEQMQSFRKLLVEMRDSKSKTYGFVTPRDRHLEEPEMFSLMQNPAILDRVAQLLGPDLLCWRSQVFYKEAGTPKIQWHQASTFMVEDYLDPALFPADRDELFQITVWVAVDPATVENGCMQFVRGGHDRIRTLRLGGEEGFYRARFTLEFDEKNADIVPVEVKPGQFILFTERCIHGSGANDSRHDRLAFNFRLVPPSMPIYPGKKYYRSAYNGGKYFLDNWATVLMRGEDRHKLSRSISPERLLSHSSSSASERRSKAA